MCLGGVRGAVVMLLDTESEVTLISEDVWKELKLKITGIGWSHPFKELSQRVERI